VETPDCIGSSLHFNFQSLFINGMAMRECCGLVEHECGPDRVTQAYVTFAIAGNALSFLHSPTAASGLAGEFLHTEERIPCICQHPLLAVYHIYTTRFNWIIVGWSKQAGSTTALCTQVVTCPARILLESAPVCVACAYAVRTDATGQHPACFLWCTGLPHNALTHATAALTGMRVASPPHILHLHAKLHEAAACLHLG